MATIALTAAATAATTNLVGGGIAGGIASNVIGGAARLLGGQIDDAIFGNSLPGLRGPRLPDLTVQTSTYGKPIPVLYGTSRIAGNVIWSLPIKETATTNTVSGGGKGGGSGITQTQTTFSYSVTMAVAICEGEIDEIVRVWADAKVLDLNTDAVAYRIYKGDEEQLPDPMIEAQEGMGCTPAYRGLAYVVVEDFPLADYGNRIPNFTFEVKRKVLDTDSEGNTLEELITSMVIIPGSGEFVYDTEVQSKITGEQLGPEFVAQGTQIRINQNNRDNKADALVALDQLEETFPNLEWVAMVVTWFGDDLDAGQCTIQPGVEYKTGATTSPEIWNTAGFTRDTARQITLDGNGNPVYGGTPDDDSVLRLLQELNTRGYNILFYPMFFMDVPNKPWRGRVTGTPSDVSSFFTKTNGYNAFVTHYANLVKNDVDAFVIGSELIGLTAVQDVDDSFPAVDRLVDLAATVKGVVGSGVDVTYAADWSEYHHTDGGWYNLDPLWASPNIDMVGIDAYFPLTDEPQSGYDVQKVIDGWTSGEGYDWIYTDPERTIQQPLEPRFAWKNIAWWWKNQHVNPDLATTPWVPESKKIWFTEFGFPSVDGATNQPNVFFDPTSSESFFPYFSRGRVDFQAQRTGLLGTELQWKDSTMIERRFVWTWDARPFPFWPDLLDVWTDGVLWKTGHWVQGKLGLSSLSAIVADLSRRAGLEDADFDVSQLTDLVDGYVLTQRISVRRAIESLQQAYFFDAVESDNRIKYVPRGQAVTQQITEQDLVGRSSGDVEEVLSITRTQEVELPQRIDVTYLNKIANYQIGNQHSQRQVTDSVNADTLNLPIVLSDQVAKIIADVTLFNTWLERVRYRFEVPYAFAQLEPTDVVQVSINGVTHTIRVTDTQFGKPGVMRVTGVAEDISVYDFYNQPGSVTPQVEVVLPPGETDLEILDLPAFPLDDPEQGALRFAASGQEAGWRGAVIYRSDDEGNTYTPLVTADSGAVQGTATTALGSGPSTVFDRSNTVTVVLRGGELENMTEQAVLNGTNAALIGDEIVQFTTATLVEPFKYTLSGLLRGRLGTENAITDHTSGEAFVLLDARLIKVEAPNSIIGLPRLYKPVSIGSTLGATASESFTYQANALLPYAPVHVAGSRDGSDNLMIDWVRRTRLGGEWRDNVDVPLNEVEELYEVEILNGSNVVRTISTITTPQVSYPAIVQTIDFGAPQAAIDVRIYQLSAIVGRGHPAIATV